MLLAEKSVALIIEDESSAVAIQIRDNVLQNIGLILSLKKQMSVAQISVLTDSEFLTNRETRYAPDIGMGREHSLAMKEWKPLSRLSRLKQGRTKLRESVYSSLADREVVSTPNWLYTIDVYAEFTIVGFYSLRGEPLRCVKVEDEQKIERLRQHCATGTPIEWIIADLVVPG